MYRGVKVMDKAVLASGIACFLFDLNELTGKMENTFLPAPAHLKEVDPDAGGQGR